jgi:hypothetical protein
METQTTTNDWLAKEEETFKQQTQTEYEKLPSLKLVQDDITEFDIDFSIPFKKWTDNENDTIKAIIPCTQIDEKTKTGIKVNWWLNIKNPIYPEVIRAGRTGQTHFKVLQTGSKKDTKYKLK